MKIEIPTKCPTCSSLLTRVKDQLFCKNESCEAQNLKKIEAFAKTMKIKGLGARTIEKLGLEDISSIYKLDIEYLAQIIGKKLGAKLVGEIDKSKATDLSTFLSACSIPLVGNTIGRKIGLAIIHPSQINKDICIKAGLGEKTTNNIISWLNTKYLGNLEHLPISFNKIEEKVSNYTVCITGRISGYTKNSLAALLAEKGVKTVNTVNNEINYLICNARKNSSKEQKAETLNIPILTLEELLLEINK